MEKEVSVNDVSRISAGTFIKGEIFSDCDVRVDGNVEGKVYSKGKVVVGNQAIIKGEISCTNVDFWGTIEGDINVRDTLTLKSVSKVNGSIRVNKIQVELGAQINGSCNMIKPEEFDASFNKTFKNQTPSEAAAAPAASKK